MSKSPTCKRWSPALQTHAPCSSEVFAFHATYHAFVAMASYNRGMDIDRVQFLVGLLCTVVFASSKVPMLLKALRTRDLRSYSLPHLIMSTSGNLIYWVYVVGLPVGPVWFLQAFFTVADITMLTLCLSQQSHRHRAEAV